jgi:hypothetical protein
MLGLGKAVKNYIERYVKQQIGISPDAKKIKRITNELRMQGITIAGLKADIAKLSKIAHPRRNLIERKGKYYLEEENG